MIKTLKQKILYENKWVKYHLDEVEFPNGEKGEYAYHERADAGPMILPCTKDGKFLVLREWRYPLKGWTWCFPCGGIEKGETQLQAAQRELQEETGFTSEEWTKIGMVEVDPGGSSQTGPIFLAKNMEPGQANIQSTEVHEIHFFTAEEIEEKIKSDEFKNSWLLAGWCKYKMYLGIQ